MTLAAWLHDLDPFAIRFFDGVGIRWYGVAYLAGFVAGWWILRTLSKRGRLLLSPQQVDDATLALILGVLVGGRLGYVAFYQPSLLWSFGGRFPWWGVLEIHRGGMASHGGILGVALVCLWLARRWRVPALHILDTVAYAAPIGLFFGRLANFVNGELLGRIVAKPGEPAPRWSVKYPQELLTGHAPELSANQAARLAQIFDQTSRGWREMAPGPGFETAAVRTIEAVQRGAVSVGEQLAPLLAARHPSQLYQAVAEGPLLALVLVIVWAKPRKPGVVGSWFLLAYGVMRIATEFFRLPDDHLTVQRLLALSRGQWLSVGMIVAGAATLAIIVKRSGRPRVGGWRAVAAPPHDAQEKTPADEGGGE